MLLKYRRMSWSTHREIVFIRINATLMKNLVEVAEADGRFSTLVSALKAANLVETLSAEGPFTVFAPTDDAFAKLGKTSLDAILADKAKLTSTLTYHVVPENLTSSAVLSQKLLTTVQGGTLTVSAIPAPMVNDSRIILTDIQAKNGIIHVVDKVLIPQ